MVASGASGSVANSSVEGHTNGNANSSSDGESSDEEEPWPLHLRLTNVLEYNDNST